VKPTDLRGILQYIPRFRDKVFILAVDGAAVTDENFANLLLDVAVLRSLSIRVVMVHGASAQVRELATSISRTKSSKVFPQTICARFLPTPSLRIPQGSLRVWIRN
jgi:ribosomal protein S4E